MPNTQLTHYLDEHHIHYESINHEAAFTAQEVAANAHIPGKEMVKTVMVKMDGKLTMVLMPAHVYVNLQRLRELTGASDVDIATESEFKDAFPGCELGALPPFGELYGMDLYASNRLSEDEEIVCSAGNHSELIRLPWKEFVQVSQPIMLDL